MEVPLGFMDRFKGKVFRLKKSFYDLKQSHRAWFDRFTKAMVKFGYKQSQGSHTLFIKQRSRNKAAAM